jgi:flagellar basal-body rod protein FlgG
MLRALATAATGMEAQQGRVEIIANNLANVNTAGFKRSRAEFQDILYQTMRPVGAATAAGTAVPTGQQIGLGTRMVATARVHTEGDLKQTGVPLDVAIEGDGFLPVSLPSGEIGYTRAGALKIDGGGRLVTADGYPLAANITVPPEVTPGQIVINSDGTVSIQQPAQRDMVEIGRLTLVNFPNPAGLMARGRNLLVATSVAGNPIEGQPGTAGLGTLAQGTLEMSNVKVVDEMVDLIVGQRAYEIDARVIKAADEMLLETARLR